MTNTLARLIFGFALTLPLLSHGAENRSAEEWYRLGLQTEHGEGVPVDKEQAFQHYCEAAKLGHAGALHSIGWMYLNGRGVHTNEAKAGYWLTLASVAGDRHAQRLMDRLVLPSADKDNECLLGKKEQALPIDTAIEPAVAPKVKTTPKPKKSGPKMYCAYMGPVDDAPQRRALLDFMWDHTIAAKAVERHYPLGLLYQVYRVPLGAEKEARNTIAQYRGQGLSDLHLITAGDLKYGVSLGAYRIEANAIRRVKRLAELGIEAAYRTQDPIRQQTWIEFATPAQHRKALQNRFPAMIIEPISCKRGASTSSR